MPVERREQVTRVEAVRVNGQPEELAGLGGRRQPSLGGTSRMNREVHVRICERLGVQIPGATRQLYRPTLPGRTSQFDPRFMQLRNRCSMKQRSYICGTHASLRFEKTRIRNRFGGSR